MQEIETNQIDNEFNTIDEVSMLETQVYLPNSLPTICHSFYIQFTRVETQFYNSTIQPI